MASKKKAEKVLSIQETIDAVVKTAVSDYLKMDFPYYVEDVVSDTLADNPKLMKSIDAAVNKAIDEIVLDQLDQKAINKIVLKKLTA